MTVGWSGDLLPTFLSPRIPVRSPRTSSTKVGRPFSTRELAREPVSRYGTAEAFGSGVGARVGISQIAVLVLVTGATI